jgi:membrane protein DedA with SNARE-associated domain
MKPKPWAIISGCGCAFLTLVGGSGILTLAGYLLFKSGVRDAQPEVVIPIATLISVFLGVLLGCGVGFLVYRWRQKKDN